jgi:hypothetical protein
VETIEFPAETKKSRKGNGNNKGKGYKVLPNDFTHPHWRADGEMLNVLAEEHLDYEFIEVPIDTYKDLADLSDYASKGDEFQIRTTSHTDVIVAYEKSLAAGEKLPTPTVGPNLERVDMYHRVIAAVNAGITDLVCIRIKGSDLHPWQRELIATMRNNRHGLRQTSGETLQVAKKAVSNGWTIDEAARKLRIDSSALRRAILVEETTKKARRLGVEPQFTGLKKSVQYDLGNSGLHDRPFKEFVKMLDEYKPTVAKSSSLLNEVLEAPSDAKAVQIIKEQRERLAPPTLPTIGAPVVTGNGESVDDEDRVLSFRDGAKAFSTAYGPFATVLRDEAVISALLQGQPTNQGYAKIRKALEEMREPFEKLVAHFGV